MNLPDTRTLVSPLKPSGLLDLDSSGSPEGLFYIFFQLLALDTDSKSMPFHDERSEFKKQFEAQKSQNAERARAAAKKAAPRPNNELVLANEIKRLRKENEILKLRATKAKNAAAGVAAQANRMSNVPNHVVRDMAKKVMDALNGA